MKILILITFLVISTFAEVKVISSEILSATGKDSIYSYALQTICKNGYQYSVVSDGRSVSITQDFKQIGINSTPIECRNDK